MSRQSKLLIYFSCYLASVFSTSEAFSQCCSTGSPVGTAVNVGILVKKTLRANTFYRYSFSNTYYEQDHVTDKNTALTSANYNFAGIVFGYGIGKRMTLEADFGYFFNKTQYLKYQSYEEKGYGLSNGGVTMKYGLFLKPLKQVEITGGIGIRYPFTFEPQMQNGVQLSPDVQPSTHAFGASGMLFLNKGFPDITLRVFSINKFDYNFHNKYDYQYGHILMNTLFASKKVVQNLYVILQLRNEWKSRDTDEGRERENTGYDLLTFTPQLSYSIAGKWNVSVLYDIPVYKFYNGKQMTPSYSCAVSISRDIYLGTRIK